MILTAPKHALVDDGSPKAGLAAMSILRNITRRIKQINLLIKPPENLRRRHTRYEINFDVQVNVGGRMLNQQVVDVSSGGMMVAPGFNADLREAVRISVSGLLTDAPARVVGLRPNGVALQFDSDAHGDLLTRWLLESSQSQAVQ